MDAVFLKGYQWPFDPRKVNQWGSSLIDLLVYNETQIKNRRVWLDFRRNPTRCCRVNGAVSDTARKSDGGELDFGLCSEETYTYLNKSNALFGQPIDRLAHMNPPAIQLYKDHGIDLYSEMLEIAVCAQHNNGGLLGNIWSESNLRHFFPVGEANGIFGVYRPGGSALNSTQVSSLRAAQFIAANYTQPPMDVNTFIAAVEKQCMQKFEFAERISEVPESGVPAKWVLQKRMTDCGAHIRSLEKIEKAIQECKSEIKAATRSMVSGDTVPGSLLPSAVCRLPSLPEAFRNRDILLTQYIYLCAIREYILKGGGSRGSYLIQDKDGTLPLESLPEIFRFSLDGGELLESVCEIAFDADTLECQCDWKPVRPIPVEENWFENIWTQYREGNVIK